MGEIPPQAKRVFEGVIFDVYHWEQLLYDGKTTATFEILKRPDTVVVLAVHDGKILIARDEQPHRPAVITLIAGRVNGYDEPPLEAAKREFLEETGYQAESWEPWKTFAPYSKMAWTTHYFIARNLTKVAKPDPGPGEIVTPRWVSFDEFLELTKNPTFQNAELVSQLYRMSDAELAAFRERLGL